jgi:hypothetical protein
MNLDWQSVAVVVGAGIGSAAAAYRWGMRRRARRLEERAAGPALAPDYQPRIPTRKEWDDLFENVQEHTWEIARMKEERGTLAAQVADFQKEVGARLDQMAKEERERYECLSGDIANLRVDLAKLGRAGA